MPTCPTCGSRYAEGATQCRECGEELGLREELTCGNCDGIVKSDELFCSSCGIVLEAGEGEIDCEEHQKRPAVGMCVVCGKPVCEDCARKKKNAVFCDSAEHAKIHRQWKVVYTTKIDFEAEMLRTNLDQAGIKSHLFSQFDYASFAAFNRSAMVKVMVPREHAPVAQKVLRDLDLLDDENRSL